MSPRFMTDPDQMRNMSFNYTRGTSRGLHRQMPPYAEAKLVRRILRVPPSLSRAPEAIFDGIRDRGRDGRARNAGGVADRGGAESRAASTCWRFELTCRPGRHSSAPYSPSRPSQWDDRLARAVDAPVPAPRRACDRRSRSGWLGMNDQTLNVGS